MRFDLLAFEEKFKRVRGYASKPGSRHSRSPFFSHEPERQRLSALCGGKAAGIGQSIDPSLPGMRFLLC